MMILTNKQNVIEREIAAINFLKRREKDLNSNYAATHQRLQRELHCVREWGFSLVWLVPLILATTTSSLLAAVAWATWNNADTLYR